MATDEQIKAMTEKLTKMRGIARRLQQEQPNNSLPQQMIDQINATLEMLQS